MISGVLTLEMVKIMNLQKNEETGSNETASMELEIPDQYDPLHKLANSVLFHQVVKQLCPRSFSILFQLLEQVDICRDLSRKTESPGMLLICDHVLEHVRMKNYISGNVFFIVFAIDFQNEIVNILQLLTENNSSSNLIDFWQTLLLKKYIPRVIILSYSELILSTACFAINCCTFKEYNLKCYQFLRTGDSSLIPAKIIKIDVISILISMSRYIFWCFL